MAIAPIDASFIELKHDERHGHTAGKLRLDQFEFEGGKALSNVEIAFETWGKPNAARDNAVVVCHALTGDSHCGPGADREGWWEELIGPGRWIDTNEKFVISSNVLGGCAGSTGPASQDEFGRPYALHFPLITIRDIVRAQIKLVEALGLDEVDTVIGGSLGGMQAWEWPFLAPGRVKNTVVIAAQPAFSALGMGYNEAMRQAIVSDPEWKNGNYYPFDRGPVKGMMAARSIGMLTYRTQQEFEHRFGRTAHNGRSSVEHPSRAQEHGSLRDSGTDLQSAGGPALSISPFEAFTQPQYAVESYLHYQGQKLYNRFDANSYLYLTRAMDTHDIGRGRGGLLHALSRLQTRLTVVGIDTDYLFDAVSLEKFAKLAQQAGVDARYQLLTSIYGHDAFLLEQAQLSQLLREAERGVHQ